MEDLSEYLSIAKKILCKFSQQISKDEDAIADVAHAIMWADYQWNPEYRSKTNTVRTKQAFRYQRAIWAICKYLKDKSKHPTLSLSYISPHSFSTVPLSGFLAEKLSYNPSFIVEQKDENNYQNELITQLLGSNLLTRRQSKYISEYYLQDKTLQEVGDMFGVTREAVRQGISKGISAMKGLL